MNYEKLWFKLKQHINSKNSHGKNEILNAMMNLEIEENSNENTGDKQAFQPEFQGFAK